MTESDSCIRARVRPRYFIPVFLYPHVKYRTRHGILDLIAKYRLADHDHLIVVADDAQSLEKSLAVRELQGDLQRQKEDERKLLDRTEVVHLFKPSADCQDERKRGQLFTWSQIASTDPFAAFEARLIKALRASRQLMQIIDEVVERRLALFNRKSGVERVHQAEFDTTVSEISMSLYCTEILSYWTEIWERPLEANSADPLVALYRDHPDIVMATCQRPQTMRQLDFLYASRFDDFV